ncbi:MAG: hypothetical protein LBC89_06915 [Bacteroidales bacterium]|jgi:hypothetical protein|nr:hypothetical protein [Bacteroidales bacterium]
MKNNVNRHDRTWAFKALASLTATAMFIACAINLSPVISKLFSDTNIFSAGYFLPIAYAVFYTAAVICLFIFSCIIIWRCNTIEEKEEDENIREGKFKRMVKYYIFPILLGLLGLLGVLAFLIFCSSHWIFIFLLVVAYIYIVSELRVAEKQNRFIAGFFSLPIIITLFYIFVFSLHNWLSIVLIILSVLWFVYAVLQLDGFDFDTSEEPTEDTDTSTDTGKANILQSVTAQKLLNEEIAELHSKAEKNLNEEIGAIRKEYITQSISDDLEIEPAIRELIKENKEYLDAVKRITKRITNIHKK